MKDRKFYSTREVAEALGLRRYQLAYLLETHQVPEPALRVAGKRVWSKKEMEAAAARLQEQKTEPTPTNRPPGGHRKREGDR